MLSTRSNLLCTVFFLLSSLVLILKIRKSGLLQLSLGIHHLQTFHNSSVRWKWLQASYLQKIRSRHQQLNDPCKSDQYHSFRKNLPLLFHWMYSWLHAHFPPNLYHSIWDHSIKDHRASQYQAHHSVFQEIIFIWECSIQEKVLHAYTLFYHLSKLKSEANWIVE